MWMRKSWVLFTPVVALFSLFAFSGEAFAQTPTPYEWPASWPDQISSGVNAFLASGPLSSAIPFLLTIMVGCIALSLFMTVLLRGR